MTDKQPEALRLADELLDGMSDEHWNQLNADAAALLRTQHSALERKEALLRQALMLCQWIGETQHPRGSVNGLAAQIKYAIEQELSQ